MIDYECAFVWLQTAPLMTSSNGAPVEDKTASMSAGPLGPLVLQDFTLIDELAHFDRERIPERVVHAKGAGESVLSVIHLTQGMIN